MAEPFLGEVRLFSFVFPPKHWALCNGQLLPINQSQALFSLLGTTFGGDGRVNFALPELRGRTPIHKSASHSLGARGGASAHTLSINEIPVHTHTVNATSANADQANPSNRMLGRTAVAAYGQAQSLVSMHAAMIANMGGTQAHTNMQPFLTLNFCIALQGIFPSPT